MNKIILYIFALCLITQFTEVNAQQVKEHKSFNREAFESKRNAFITAEIGLTPEEAAAFIPLCNELQQKKFEAGKDCRKKQWNIHKQGNASAEEYNEAMDACLNSSIREAELEKEYYGKFRKILPPEKLFKYKSAEMKFAKMFMKERQKNKNKK